MEDILYPSKIELTPGENPNEATLTAEPFFHGYGMTVGNSLRRVMLSSLPGAAFTAVRIKGAPHEFHSIPNVKEDVLEIVLNLKQVRMKCWSEEPVKVTLTVKGEKAVTAGDIKTTSDVEIVNPDLHIATLTDKSAELEMELTVERGRGYLPTEERGKEKMELGTIALDALFSPVVNVGFRTENVRVGDITNYDKMIMTIETDGTLTPKEAVEQSTRILLNHFNLFLGLGESPAAEAPAEETAVAEEATETAADEDVGEVEEEKEEKPKRSRKKAE